MMRASVAVIAVGVVVIAAMLIWDRAERACDEVRALNNSSIWLNEPLPWWC